jgi:hypothetical protein
VRDRRHASPSPRTLLAIASSDLRFACRPTPISTVTSRSWARAFNRFPGFNYEAQGVFQEREQGRIKFYTYVVRE